MLDPTWTKARQDRLRALMEVENLDVLYLSDVRDIYYATGQLLTVPDAAGNFPALFALSAGGSSWLVSHTMEGEALVSQRFAYEPALGSTMNPDPMGRLPAFSDREAGFRSTHSFRRFRPSRIPMSSSSCAGPSAVPPRPTPLLARSSHRG
jgi:Xaa-Pro aminopeptidase